MSTPFITTRYYRAPELFLGNSNYNTKFDIFSIRCIIAEILILNHLFPRINDGVQIFEYMHILAYQMQLYLKN